MTSLSVSCPSRALRLSLTVDLPVAVAELKQQLGRRLQVLPWRIDLLDGKVDGQWLPSTALVENDARQLQMSVRQGAKRTISVDAKLVNEISCASLKDSYLQNLREDLLGPTGRCRYSELLLTVTDWEGTMPPSATEILAEFLVSRRDEPNEPCLVHLDLHGQLPRLLEAMRRNRQYYESICNSLETLELSLTDVNPQQQLLPCFANLSALRMYKPQFPWQDTDDYSMRLLNANRRSLHDVAIVGLEEPRVFAHLLQVLAGEDFDDRTGSSSLWLVGTLANVTGALRCLGDLLGALRSTRPGTDNFLLKLGKLNIHVEDAGREGFGPLRSVAAAALNRGLDEEQIQRRPKVLTTIRSTQPAMRHNETLMCLFDICALSIGVATVDGLELLEHSEASAMPGAVLTVARQDAGEKLRLECSNLAGDMVLAAELHKESTVADLEELMVTSLSNAWKGATFLLDDLQVSPETPLSTCKTLVVKEEKVPVMTSIVQRNTTVPTKKSQFFTGAPGQEKLCLQILEGEPPVAKDNHKVGQLCMDGLRPAYGDRILVEVIFDIDANDVLHVRASDVGSGSTSQASFPFEHRWRIGPAELEGQVRRAEDAWRLRKAIEERSQTFDLLSRALRPGRQTAEAATLWATWARLLDETSIDADVDYKSEFQALLDVAADQPMIEEVD